MDYAVLNIGLRKNCFYCLGEACKVISAGNEDILNASVTQAVQHSHPEFGTFIFAYPHTENVFPAVHINAYRYVHSLLDDLSFAADMIVYRVHKYDRINALQRSLLPFFCFRQYLAADRRIRHAQTVNITDMICDIEC